MYKSHLQELCQRRSWPLPLYTNLKEGPPHGPFFKATVVVNGIAFETSDFFKRAKEAQIEAAKIALNHFTSPAEAGVAVEGTSPGPEIKIGAQTGEKCAGSGVASGISINLNKRPLTDEIRTPIAEERVTNSEKAPDTKRNKLSGELHMFKNQLQSVVLKKGYNLPIYSFESEGPPHNCRFKSKVIINGQTYESPDYFCTLKESEHAAAKVALLSLVPHESQDNELDKSIFKNLLQELAQKSRLKLPVYDTTGSGADHIPTFVSKVVVGGETFFGEIAKTKKHAEMNAAKVAYTCLSQCENLGPSGSAPICVPQAVLASNLKAIDTSDLGETNKLDASSKLILSESVTGLPKGGDQKAPKQIPSCTGIGSKGSFGSSNLDITTTLSPPTHADPWDSLAYIPLSQIEGSSPQAPSDVLHGSVSDSNVDIFSGPSSTLHNEVRVYPRMLNMDFPEGATVQHCDDKWIAVKFPVKHAGQ